MGLKRYDLYEKDHELMEGENGRYYLVTDVTRTMIPRPTAEAARKAVDEFETTTLILFTETDYGSPESIRRMHELRDKARSALLRLMGVENE